MIEPDPKDEKQPKKEPGGTPQPPPADPPSEEGPAQLPDHDEALR
jgi:hypothetical protein